MPRPKAILQSEFPYHVTARCVNREWFSIPMSQVWDLMQEHLYFTVRGYQCKIHSFVLMNNHFHLLLSTPKANLSSAMAYFMKATSDELTRRSKRINQTYGSRHYRGVIRSYHYFLLAYKYVYRNPVEARLCKNVEDYPYSTLSGLLGKWSLLIPTEEDRTLFSDVTGTLVWLNKKPKVESRDAVCAALKRREFKLPRDRKTRRPCTLENDLL
jgi:REP element-mobilizing transposase RayT